MSLLPYLHHVAARTHLSADEARDAMAVLLAGEATPVEVAGFLVALRMKGETAQELAGFARAMREQMIGVDAGGDVVDNCGTGGDASGTFNVSTTASFVMAGAGAHVAKHGNRSISSATGAADVLEALGIRVTSTAQEAAQLIRDIGIGFLFAPAFHPAMKHVQPVRRELKMRTVFNLLGPLANPARALAQVIGAPSVHSASLMAEAISVLGARRVFVVHGHGGLDEISITGPTDVFDVKNGAVKKLVWEPGDFGVPEADLASLKGGDAAHNAAILEAVLEGERSPRRDIVVANAAAGLMAAGLAANLHDGAAMATESIDSGAAWAKLGVLRQRCPA
jgi:anthranilate phosphoribosyltransferase